MNNGQVPATTPFGRFEQLSRPTEEYLDVHSLLGERVPDLRQAAWGATYEQLALVGQIAGDEGTHEAVRLILNLAVNDFRDLLNDLDAGSGRSAMRAARAIIEHAINLHTVAGSLAEASAYVEHLDQGPSIMLKLATGADRLAKGSRRSYMHALRSAGGAAQRRFQAAVAEHGAWFRQGWARRNLKDRAERHGLGHLYDYYKLASLVMHGSAGGSLGILRVNPAGLRIFRTGPALELAPVAMWAGVAGYREVLAALQNIRTDIDIDAYTRGLDTLDGLWVDYFNAMKEIDEALWPKERTRPPSTVLAFSKTGDRRWYLHLPMAASLVPADEPDLPDWIEEQVSALIDKVVSEQPHIFRHDQRWLTAILPHVTVAPADGARPIPDTALMEFPVDGWEPRVLGEVGRGRNT